MKFALLFGFLALMTTTPPVPVHNGPHGAVASW